MSSPQLLGKRSGQSGLGTCWTKLKPPSLHAAREVSIFLFPEALGLEKMKRNRDANPRHPRWAAGGPGRDAVSGLVIPIYWLPGFTVLFPSPLTLAFPVNPGSRPHLLCLIFIQEDWLSPLSAEDRRADLWACLGTHTQSRWHPASSLTSPRPRAVWGKMPH